MLHKPIWKGVGWKEKLALKSGPDQTSRIGANASGTDAEPVSCESVRHPPGSISIWTLSSTQAKIEVQKKMRLSDQSSIIILKEWERQLSLHTLEAPCKHPRLCTTTECLIWPHV
jgi:hypothetical protein